MKTLSLALCFVLLPETIWSQLRVVPEDKPPVAFAGEGRPLRVVFHNSADKTVAAEIHARLIQTSSATIMRLSEGPWKRVQVFAGQTIMEFAYLDFPAVKAETRFLVQWLEGTNQVIGTTEVLVYPPDLLKELKPLAGEAEGALGLFDPLNQLKPLVKNAKVDFVDLADAGLEGFRGKLAILGPFGSKAQMQEGLAEQIQKWMRKDVAVVWIQPPPEKRDKLAPSFYMVPGGPGNAVIVQAGLVSNLPENPQSQLNLLHCARLALHPEPARLPYLTSQP